MQISRMLLLLAACMTMFGATSVDTFHWNGKVPAGQFIEIRGINGSIHAEPSSGNDVDVIAYKTGAEYDPAGIAVKVVEHDGGVTICAVYTAPDSPGNCLPSPGAPNGAGSDVQVDFTVHVPKGVRFVGRTVNGLVEAQSLDADAEGHTVNGNLRLSTAGTAQGETVNGSIVASVGRLTSGLKFSTVNGAITLEMPRSASARVHANTVNGRILTDFPLPVRGHYIGQHAEGILGRGGPELRLATVNGSISLKRSRRNF